MYRWYSKSAVVLGVLAWGASIASSAPLPLSGPGPHDKVLYENGYRIISFAILGSFNYRSRRDTPRPRKKPLPGDGVPTHELPAYIKALNGQKVTLAGYMMPLEIDEHHIVKSFAILPHLASCCFGGAPKMNMWVLVITDDHTHMPVIDDMGYGSSIFVYGILDVGEKDSEDSGTSLYRLKADKVITPS